MIKTIVKHFIFERCIDVAFSQITENFIRPDMTNVKIQEYMNRIQKQFPELKIESMSVLKFPRACGKSSRYDDAGRLIGDGKYYRTTTFGEIGSTLRS